VIHDIFISNSRYLEFEIFFATRISIMKMKQNINEIERNVQ